MNEVQTDVKKVDFKDWWENKIGFTVKADDNACNKGIHDSFKEYSRVECDNNYTWALDALLRYKQEDYKFDMLFKELQTQALTLNDLKASIEELSKKATVQEDEDTGAF